MTDAGGPAGNAGIDVRGVADRIRAAAGSGDPARMQEVFHPEARVWENTTRIWLDLGRIVGFHERLAGELPSLTFEDVRVTPTADGYVDQHVKRFVTTDGAVYEAPACLVVQLRDGLLYRAEEYVDSAQKPAGADPSGGAAREAAAGGRQA